MSRFLMSSFVFLFCVCPHAFAANPSPTPPSPASSPSTLAKALLALPTDTLSDGTVLMSVGAEHIFDIDAAQRQSAQYELTPQSALPKYDDSHLDSIAVHYKRIIRNYGHVVALAPSTMVTLNTNPSPLEMSSATLPLDQALIALMGMLTPEQIGQLGKDGLGWDDLTEDQRLFVQTSVARSLDIVPSSTPMTRYSDYQKQIKPLGQEVFGNQMRLHAHLVAGYSFSLPQMNIGLNASPADSDLPDAIPYKLAGQAIQNRDAVNNSFRAEIPNASKPSDLDVGDAAFNVITPIRDVKTVDDLVTRIAKLTKKELYCDPRYGHRTITWLGNTAVSENTAEDLLRALACCLTGTWRQVGDAYVLTDDQLGIGSRRQWIAELINGFNAKLTKMMDASAKNLKTHQWYDHVTFASDDVAALPSDLVDKVVSHKTYTNYIGTLLYGELPSSTQDELRVRLKRAAVNNASANYYYPSPGNAVDGMQGYAKISGAEAYPKVFDALNPNFSVGVTIHCRVSLDVPGVGQVALDRGLGQSLVDMPFTNDEPDFPKPVANSPKAAVTMPQRGLVAVVKSASEARALVDKMSDLGLNTLFCDVFFEGQTYFRNSIIPASDSVSELVLGAAIEEGRQRGVSVYAMLDTLRWRGSQRQGSLPLDLPEDVTITLETASESLGHQESTDDDPFSRYMITKYTGSWVSPGEPRVQDTLIQLVGALARTPGLAGLVFADTVTPGYVSSNYIASGQTLDLGYTPHLRLEFLRSQHVDPIDISIESLMSIGATHHYSSEGKRLSLSLPNFEDRTSAELSAKWQTARDASDRVLLARLFARAKASMPTLPLVMQERTNGMTYDPWTDPKNFSAVLDQNGAPTVKSGSLLALPFAIFGKKFPISTVGEFLKLASSEFPRGQKNVGFLFDLRSFTSKNNPEHDLDTLAQSVTWTSASK